MLQPYSKERLNELLKFLDPNEQKELADILEAEERKLAEQVEAGDQDRIWQLIVQGVPSWEAGPLLWLSRYTKTEDTHAIAKNTEFRVPFPSKSYLLCLFDYLLFDQCKDEMAGPQLFVIKTREMLFSWCACGYITWMCQFLNGFWIAQSGKESKGMELVDYGRKLYMNQPEWMKAKNPLIIDNTMELQWQNGGRFKAVPSGADQARMFHPMGYFQDESAFLDDAEASYNAFRPVVRQAICGSTDEISWFHNECKGNL